MKKFIETFDEADLMTGEERAAMVAKIKADCDIVCWDEIDARIAAGESVRDNCWLYKGTVSPDGYATRHIARKSRSVGRFMLAAKSGLDIRMVRHGVEACHNKLICRHQTCVNPRHLYWGTKKQNRADREKDRWAAIYLDRYFKVEYALFTLKHIAEHAKFARASV